MLAVVQGLGKEVLPKKALVRMKPLVFLKFLSLNCYFLCTFTGMSPYDCWHGSYCSTIGCRCGFLCSLFAIPFPPVTERSHFILKLHSLVTCLSGERSEWKSSIWIPKALDTNSTYKVGTCWIYLSEWNEALLAQSPLHIPTGPFEDRILFRDALIISQLLLGLLEKVPAVPCKSKIPQHFLWSLQREVLDAVRNKYADLW